MSEKKVIKISVIVAQMNEGVTREEIGVEYGLTPTETKAMFQHPALKGIRVKKRIDLPFVLEDDTAEIAATPSEVPTAPENVNATPEESGEDTEVPVNETPEEEAPVNAEDTANTAPANW